MPEVSHTGLFHKLLLSQPVAKSITDQGASLMRSGKVISESTLRLLEDILGCQPDGCWKAEVSMSAVILLRLLATLHHLLLKLWQLF
jgi:hypothetical protein